MLSTPAERADTGEPLEPSPRRVHFVLGVLAVVGFALLRILPLVGARIGGGLDTIGYEAQAKLPIFSHDFVAGAWPAGYPLFLKAVDYNPTAAMVVQVVVAVLAWVWLAAMAARAARHATVRAACFIVVLGIGGSLVVIQWDPIIGSDSLSISLGVALFAALLWLRERFTAPRVVAFAGLALAASIDRDSTGLLFAAIALVVIGGVLLRRLRRPWLVVAAILLCGTVLASLSANGGQRWQAPLRDVITERLLQSPPRTAYLQRHGMPLTAHEIATARGRCVTTTPTLGCATIKDPRFYRWIHDDGRSVYQHMLLAFPGTTIAEPMEHLGTSIGTRVKVEARLGNGTLERSPISHVLDTVVFVFDPTGVLAVSLLLLASCVALWIRRRRGAFTIAAITVLLVYVHLWIVWISDALEVTRHSLLASVQLRIGVWLGILWVIDALLDARDETRERRVEARPASAADDPDRAPAAAADPVTP